MQILGIVGGIASGKSAVSAALGELGAVVLDADRAAHAVLQQEAVKQALRERWGEGIFDADGQIDRAAVARQVFTDSPTREADRHFLEQTIHPRIHQHFKAKLIATAALGEKMAVIDAPLLLEAGWEDLCNDVVFVDCDEKGRLERALRRGWTEQQFMEREAAQMPIAEKRQKATVTVDNSGPPEAMRAQLQELWQKRWQDPESARES